MSVVPLVAMCQLDWTQHLNLRALLHLAAGHHMQNCLRCLVIKTTQIWMLVVQQQTLLPENGVGALHLMTEMLRMCSQLALLPQHWHGAFGLHAVQICRGNREVAQHTGNSVADLYPCLHMGSLAGDRTQSDSTVAAHAS